MRLFKIAEDEGDVSVDLEVNLPMDVSFVEFFLCTLTKTLIDRQHEGRVKPVGTSDYCFAPNLELPGSLGCLFSFLGQENLVGEDLHIWVTFSQGTRSERLKLPQSKMKSISQAGLTSSALSKTSWIRLDRWEG